MKTIFWKLSSKREKAVSSPIDNVKQQYNYWRLRIFVCMYFGYVTYYFTRKSFTFAMPALMDDLGYSKAELGFLASLLYITYGLSKFVSGILSDKSNPRYFMSSGLLLTGICNLLFAQSSSLLGFAVFWGLNGFFQGWGFPPIAKQMTYWFSKKERGVVWSLQSTSNNLGGAIIPLLVACVLTSCSWRWAMYVPAVISILMGLILMIGIRGEPESLGLPAIEVWKGEAQPQDLVEQKASCPPSLRKVCFNRAILLLAIASFFVHVLRSGVNDWMALYLHKVKSYTLLEASASVSWFEIGGFAGALASGWISDRLFKGQRIPFTLWCGLGLAFILTLFWQLADERLLILDNLFLAAMGFAIFAPQALLGLASAEYVDKRAAGTAYGFTSGLSYLGSAASGYPLGKIMDFWGWQGFFITLLLNAFLLFLFTLPLLRQPPSEASISEPAQPPLGARATAS